MAQRSLTLLPTMSPLFPVLIRSFLDSDESSCHCVRWSHAEDGSALVHIVDNAAFCKLYGYRKTVWAKQFSAYGFKNFHKGHTQKQKRVFTYFYHASFTPRSSPEQLRSMRKIRSKKKMAVSFSPSGAQYSHILQRSGLHMHTTVLCIPPICSFEQLCWQEEFEPLQLMRCPLMTPLRRRARRARNLK